MLKRRFDCSFVSNRADDARAVTRNYSLGGAHGEFAGTELGDVTPQPAVLDEGSR